MLGRYQKSPPMKLRLKRFLLQTAVGRVCLIPVRAWRAMRYFRRPLGQMLIWCFRSREVDNFTYPLTEGNISYLAHTIASVTGISFAQASSYVSEVLQDVELKQHLLSGISASRYGRSSDSCELGRRIGWYVFARILKPRVIVETGVHFGIGACVLCSALLRNGREGHPGQYYGTDINPDAGFLLTEPYSTVGKILYGDSLESLKTIPQIDLFINDSDHSADYERREYELVLPKLSPSAVLLGDNSHDTKALADFSAAHGRNFVFFKEQPAHHWYPGGGIGISYPRIAKPAPSHH